MTDRRTMAQARRNPHLGWAFFHTDKLGMDPAETRIFEYEFGYHCPIGRRAFLKDPDFDYDKGGVIRIRATAAQEALLWGRVLAKWYVAELFGDKITRYEWSHRNYSDGVGAPRDDHVSDPLEVDQGSYPVFDDLRRSLRD